MISAARMVPKQKLDNIYVLLKCEISPLTIALPETGVFFVDNSAQKNYFWPFFCFVFEGVISIE